MAPPPYFLQNAYNIMVVLCLLGCIVWLLGSQLVHDGHSECPAHVLIQNETESNLLLTLRSHFFHFNTVLIWDNI